MSRLQPLRDAIPRSMSFANIDSDRTGKHRHREQTDFIAEHFSVNCLRGGYWMFLGLGPGQLKADSLYSAVQFLDGELR